jgi:hypothetical protein
MNVATIYTFSSVAAETFTLSYNTNDWGWYNGYQAAPSLNQGFNTGICTVSEVQAYMPVYDPGGPGSPRLLYYIEVKNLGNPADNPNETSMFDIYNAWQQT